MIESLPTFSLTLDIVLLGSGLTVGPIEWLLLGVLAVLWSAFGVWLARTFARGRAGLTTGVHVIAGLGLAAAVLARDAPLFYSGVAIAGYGAVALLLLAHGYGHVRTAAVQVVLMVLGDLALFELLVSLYSGAASTEFSELSKAYAVKGQGVSFASFLLVVTGGSKIAVLLLLLPLKDRLAAWRSGAASGLFCVALVAGVLPLVRLVDPLLSPARAAYSLLAMLAAAVVICLLAAVCVVGKSRIDTTALRLSALASRFVAVGLAGLALMETVARRLAPLASALEQRMLSWSFAVSAAATLALILALAFGGFPA